MLTLGDDTGTSIEVTIWSEQPAQDFGVGTCVAFRNSKLSEWNGVSLSANWSPTDTVVAPDHPEATACLKWYAKSGQNAELKQLSVQGGGQKDDICCSIAELEMLAQSDPEIMGGNKAGYFCIDGFVSWIFGVDGEYKKPLYYLSCAACKKKVTDEAQGYFCQGC